MRIRLAMLSVLLALVVVTAGNADADILDPGSPTYANRILGSFLTPTVEPGESVEFAFNIANPYNDPNVTMTDIVLAMSIFRYVTQDDSLDVDEDFPDPPLIMGAGVEVELSIPDLGQRDERTVETPMDTSERTPHGSYFSQRTYFVRFKIDFRFEGNSTHVVFQSRGFFTDDQWEEAV